jgi:hypothetical protein
MCSGSENKELTGKRRYRIFWSEGKPLLILQVEVTWLDTIYTGWRIDTQWHTGWRDARLEDLTIYEVKEVTDEKS